ncbi:MAG: hypothetical protein L3J58_11815 [Emcibacter sp.]|nr:hypothetical protein [Emcibacter sp.]
MTGNIGSYTDDALNNKGIDVSPSNPLPVKDFLQSVREGTVSGYRMRRKFGAAEGVGATEIPIWDVGAAFRYPVAASVEFMEKDLNT